MIIAANLRNHESELIKSVIDNTRSRNGSFNIMPPGDRFQFHSYNYHLTCVRASTFVTFHAYNCLSKCLKIITCFKKQKFSLNQFKLLPSTGLSYRWTSRRSLYTCFSHREAPRGRYSIDKPQNSHNLINCSQNTRLNSVILGLSLENSHGRLYKKIRKKRTYNNAEKP